MASISLTHKGGFTNVERRLQKMSQGTISDVLGKYGQLGVAVLASATPIDTGETRNSWDYEVEKTSRGWKLSWSNQNKTITGEPIVLLIQHGHGTGTGGYVAGLDFINPAIKPVFQLILAEVRRKVRG